MGDNIFFEELKAKMDKYVQLIYKLTRAFPKEEIYGTTSQLRRASLSVILNYIEGFARQRQAVKLNFWEISYGSLKESKYLLYFSYKENFIPSSEYKPALNLAEEIGAMLWTCIKSISC
jgi:four helix bundle protein